MNNNYTSCFAEYIQGMISARAALGYEKEQYAAALHSFDRYCSDSYPECNELTERLVMSWVPYTKIAVISMVMRHPPACAIHEPQWPRSLCPP